MLLPGPAKPALLPIPNSEKPRSLQARIGVRIDELASNPRDSRISAPLRGAGDLQKSRVGGWSVDFKIDDESRIVSLVTIERRGQVYKRL